jgi:signal transduction histidine kinase
MTSTAKTRFYLVLIAVFPPLLMMSVIYFYSLRRIERSGLEEANDNLNRFIRLHDSYLKDLEKKAADLSVSPGINRALLLIRSGRSNQVDLTGLRTDFDLIEILDTTYKVLASDHRLGAIGEGIKFDSRQRNLIGREYLETIEYDIDGRHTAFTYIFPAGDEFVLYVSKYIDRDYMTLIKELLSADVGLYFGEDSGQTISDYTYMDKGQLYQAGDTLMALLAGGQNSGFALIARFDISGGKPVFFSLLRIAGLVAILSVLLAVVLGIYITGQTKREIDNLIDATRRIADGDLSTPVMAYEEGEFSDLADSFTEMKSKLRKTLNELATAEKIAAWKEISQKIAHEIKNPLTPISISIDDLRKSYFEKLPDFERTINETTTVIKTEIDRLIKLLDQFVRFARMEPAIMVETNLDKIIEDITGLYQREMEAKKLSIKNASERDRFKLDPEKIKQLFINLIKNGLESSPDAVVAVELEDADDGIRIRFEDTGPGFPKEVMDYPFRPYTSAKKGGFGLGLVISARIVHDHGGTIEIYNREEGGGGIIMNLPFQHG